jgi:hypothetical protein
MAPLREKLVGLRVVFDLLWAQEGSFVVWPEREAA